MKIKSFHHALELLTKARCVKEFEENLISARVCKPIYTINSYWNMFIKSGLETWYDFIEGAFIWDITPQGVIFWEEIQDYYAY